MATEDKADYYTKTAADAEFLTSTDLVSENANTSLKEKVNMKVATLDTIAYENLSYRDIFETNNTLGIQPGFADGTWGANNIPYQSPVMVASGAAGESTEGAIGSYVLKTFGTVSRYVKTPAVNLIDVNNITHIDDRYLDDNGVEQTWNGTSYTTMYIPVSENTEYIVSGTFDSGQSARTSAMICYDSNKQFILRIKGNTTELPYPRHYVTPAGCAYVDFQYGTASDTSTWSMIPAHNETYQAVRVKCIRHIRGNIGLTGNNCVKITASTDRVTQSEDNNWEVFSAIFDLGEVSSGIQYFGSAPYANLDAYIDMPVSIPTSIFTVKPDKFTFDVLYNNYLTIVRNNGSAEVSDYRILVEERTGKKPYQRRTFWKQKLNCNNPITNFTARALNTCENVRMYEDNTVLYLPDSYTPDGEPTKLIIFCKQGSSEIKENEDVILEQCQFFMRLGYAILGFEAIPDKLCSELRVGKNSAGNYTQPMAASKAYKKVTEEYNIDKNGCYIYGWSQGGRCMFNVVEDTELPILAAATQAPVCSYRYHDWDMAASKTIDGVTYENGARLAVARLFNYPAVTTNAELKALQYDESKTLGYDTFTKNVENPYTGFVQDPNNTWKWIFPTGTTADDITMVKKFKCPVKVWVADNDGSISADVTKCLVKAIKNSGQIAEINVYSSGGHSIAINQTSIGKFMEHGKQVDLKPMFLEMAQWFERFGGYSTEQFSPKHMYLEDGLASIVENSFGELQNTGAANRFRSASIEVPLGILIRNTESITINGLKPGGSLPTLCVDYFYGTSEGPCEMLDLDNKHPWAPCVGTGSNFVSNDYYKWNKNGDSDSVTITNNYGHDYYFFFLFRSVTTIETMYHPYDYNLTYTINSDYSQG